MIPHRCPKCCDEIVETAEGFIQNFYGVLVKDGVPMTGAGRNAGTIALVCPNCGTGLVPSNQVPSSTLVPKG